METEVTALDPMGAYLLAVVASAVVKHLADNNPASLLDSFLFHTHSCTFVLIGTPYKCRTLGSRTL